MLMNILTIIGASTSLLSLYLTVRPPGTPLSSEEAVLMGAGIALTGVAVFREIRTYYKTRPKRCKSKDEINDYMYNWLLNGNRVAIFSRDLSWATVPRIKDLLLTKARQGELCICLPQKTDLTDELKTAGADICTYSKFSYTPESRFTIINRGTISAQVAVGKSIKGVHTIVEYGVGEHPAFHIASDLIEILASYERQKR